VEDGVEEGVIDAPHGQRVAMFYARAMTGGATARRTGRDRCARWRAGVVALAWLTATPVRADALAKLDPARFVNVGDYLLLAWAGLAVTLACLSAYLRTPVGAWLRRDGMRGFRDARRLAFVAAALSGPLMLHHAVVAPVLGMLDGANVVACCFDPTQRDVTPGPDGLSVVRDGLRVDLRDGEVVPAESLTRARVATAPAVKGAPRAQSRLERLDAMPAYFGDDKAPSRVAVFAGSALPVQLRDGTEVALANPGGNCVVIAEDGPIAAVVVSKRTTSLLDAIVPLRGAGTIDFVDLRTGQLLRSVKVARLDGFTCRRSSTAEATLVGTAGGARWVLSQERWVKVFEVKLPRPGRPLERALADATT
jgi:hypothetical protein